MVLSLNNVKAKDNKNKEASHNKNAVPNFEKVFNDQEVLRLDIEVEETEWETLLNEVDTMHGDKGYMPFPMDNGEHRPPLGDNVRPIPFSNNKLGPRPPMHKDSLIKGRPGPNTLQHEKKLDWIECTIHFDGDTWEHTGLRIKGNSSFMAAQHSTSKKYSFKLDFDQFEEEYPSSKNQRFWGFKQLNLNNNSKDPSLMHEKVASDLMSEFNIPSAHTAFCAVYLKVGEKSRFYGIYTLVEEVDNTVIKTQFSDNSGNLYKPDGEAGTFRKEAFNEKDMFLKTNKKDADYADVKALLDVINDASRHTQATQWKAKLEGLFDVNIFIKWLAVKQTIQNWDAYGQIGHNYYLYNNPENNKLTWIPWDHNEALNQNRVQDELDYSNVNERWPLIKNILEVPEYYSLYLDYLEDFNQNVFEVKKMEKRYDTYCELLNPYIAKEANIGFNIRSKDDFYQAYQALKTHSIHRYQTINDYLNKEKITAHF